MKIYTTIIFLFFHISVIGQKVKKDSIFREFDQKWVDCDLYGILNDSSNIVMMAEKMPEFPGGNEALQKFIAKNKHKCDRSGKVFVEFIVDRDGSIKCVKILKGLSKECDNESIRFIKSMPNWTPGNSRGISMPVKYVMPLTF